MPVPVSNPFQKSLLQFFSQGASHLRPGTKILIACSGGPDSVALVWALKRFVPPLPHRFHIGHVNHKLRGRDSKQDERFVRELAKQVKWPFHSVQRPILRRTTGNLEEIAREKRYAALALMAKESGCSAILTAHTLDDQTETVLMNLIRGAGPDGLSGMEPLRALENSQIQLGRPLLQVSKAELMDWLKRSKWRYRTDKSNVNPVFLRNWLRMNVIPKLEKKAPGFKTRVARLAMLIRDEKQYWNEEIEFLEGQLLKEYRGGRLLDLGGLLSYPPAVQRRFLRRSVGRDFLTFNTVERLRHWMQSPPTSGRLFQLKKGWIAERLSKSKGSPSARLFWFKTTPAKKDKHCS